MQWNGVRPNPDRPAPLRSLMEILQQKAEPYVTQYGENQIPGAGQLLNSIMRTGTEMVPGVGDLLGAEDLQTAAQNSDWAGIGLGALAAIPGIPAFGRGVRGEARAARGVANTVADAVSTNQPMTEAEAALARYRAANPNDTGARVLSPGDQGYPTNAQWDEASQAYVAPVEPDYPIRAFHGSPHSFDRFSLDKIGTGEGAQAYGHGLYFAENEGVARQYRDQLAGDAFLRPDGSQWSPNSLQHLNVRVAARNNGPNLDASIARAQELMADASPSIRPYLLEDIAELEAVRASGGIQPNPGSMYEVGINADPNTFLDWDRPLSEQPESVMSALRNTLGGSGVDLPNGVVQLENGRWATAVDGVPIGRPQGWPNQSTAEQALKYAQEDGQYLYGTAGSILQRQRNQPEISAALAAQGIPGIRYLDAGSRGTGEGSRNYVLFNDDLVKILRKYGISGLSTTVGASALAEELDRRGQTQEF